MFACPNGTTRLPLDGFSLNIISENCSEFNQYLTRTAGTLLEDLRAFLIISRSILLRMTNDWNINVQKTKTHILGSIAFFSENGYLYEIMWENMVQPGRPQVTI